MAAEINGTRRFYLLKRLYERSICGEEGVWRAKQEAISVEALPSTFPLLEQLAEIGYSAVEDLDGADVAELLRVGLTQRQAERVLAALAPLI